MESRSPVTTESGRWDTEGRAQCLTFEEGLYALIIEGLSPRSNAVTNSTFPATYISAGPSERRASVALMSSSGEAPGWLGAKGGTVIVKVPADGGSVLVATYGVTQDVALPPLRILDLNHLSEPEGTAGLPIASADRSGREIACELILHIQRQGDSRLRARGWVGNPGQRLRVEGFAVRPLEAINPAQIEYMAFGLGGRQTPWVTDARLCGSRGRGLSLTGFAIRLVPALREKFDVVYEGYFFESGIAGPARNGEACLPSTDNDPLNAIRLRIIERPGA